MSNFQASIYNTGILSVSTNGTAMSITDYSNYDTNSENGHAQADFSNFRKIAVLQPDGTTFLFSNGTDGDAVCIVPNGATLPITDQYTYDTGDGVYDVTLYVAPRWDVGVNYQLVDGVYVWYTDGNIYKLLQNSTGDNPASSPTYWELVNYTDLSSKYTSNGKLAVKCDLEQCFITTMNAAVNLTNCYCTSSVKLCANESWVKANELSMILDNIDNLVDRLDWTGVTQLINKGKQICCCS